MNPLLSHLQPYPFERLRQLFAGVTPSPGGPDGTYNGAAANRFAVLQGSGAPSLFFTAHPGGRIANQGTTVSFTLPVRQSQSQTQPSRDFAAA